MNNVAFEIDCIVGRLLCIEECLQVVDRLCSSGFLNNDEDTTPFQDAIKGALGSSSKDVTDVITELKTLFEEAQTWDAGKEGES